MTEIASHAAAPDPYPGCMRSLDSEDVRALGHRYVAHLRTHSPDAARVTDKLPGNYLHLGFIATILPRASIIHCRRDPLDTAISLYFNDFESGHDYSNDLRAIGRLIRGMRALMTHWEKGARRAHARGGLRDPGRGPGVPWRAGWSGTSA